MDLLRRALAAIRRWRWTEFQLLIVPGALSVIGTLIVLAVPAQDLNLTWRDLWMGLVFIGLLLGTHFFLGATQRGADQVLLPAAAIIIALGLITIQRLGPSLERTYPDQGYENVAGKQMLWIGL